MKMIASPKIDSEKLAGLPWDLNKIYETDTQLLTPEKGIFYYNNGDLTVMFTDYKFYKYN